MNRQGADDRQSPGFELRRVHLIQGAGSRKWRSGGKRFDQRRQVGAQLACKPLAGLVNAQGHKHFYRVKRGVTRVVVGRKLGHALFLGNVRDSTVGAASMSAAIVALASGTPRPLKSTCAPMIEARRASHWCGCRPGVGA